MSCVSLTDLEKDNAIVDLEAVLWKKGRSLSWKLQKRYFFVSGNHIYYNSTKDALRPKGDICLSGSNVEYLKDDSMEGKGYYAIQLTNVYYNNKLHEKRIFYCKSGEQRDQWIEAFRRASCVVPVESLYEIKDKIGSGQFSIVYECIHKTTEKHYAVKIINKTAISKLERNLLKTEISILKLVDHPNIIKTENLYEDDEHVYIVMEKQIGGDLFSKLVGRSVLNEHEASRLLKPLLESVAYLHELNIVHRDLKPENILCGEDLEHIKIADFGLSTRLCKNKKLHDLCGTIAYVAPEVLMKKGYGIASDIWSIGVIMFLVLLGKLPFNGHDDYDTIQQTIKGDLKVTPAKWNKLTEEAKSLLTALLEKSPLIRITARNALKHPFIRMHNADLEITTTSATTAAATDSTDRDESYSSLKFDLQEDIDNEIERKRFMSNRTDSTGCLSSPCSPDSSLPNSVSDLYSKSLEFTNNELFA